MHWLNIVLSLLTLSNVLSVQVDTDALFRYCCSVGRNTATNPVKCNSGTALLIGNVSSEYQNDCSSIIELCCIEQRRKLACEQGKNAAKTKSTCGKDYSTDEDVMFKECCSACKLGISAKQNHRICHSQFGSPWDNIFESCCSEIPDTVDRCKQYPGELCEHICLPVQSSYRCLCEPGFSLMADSKSCQKQSTVQVTNPKLEICPNGFKYNQLKNTCDDRNECEESTSLCNSNEICVNTNGSYKCNCAVGFIRDHVTGACIDINECQTNTHSCDQGTHRCDNTIGSFHCVRHASCGTGYTLHVDTNRCEDDDECALGTHNCGPEWRCNNTIGSFRCVKKYCDPNQNINCSPVVSLPHTKKPCSFGFEPDNKGMCIDIDECKRNNICGTGKCLNTIGSYRCVNNKICGDGLRFNSSLNTCVDIDECVEQEKICEHLCTNTKASFTCACKRGFSLHEDNRSCIDENECELADRHRCMWKCNNVPGSYKCTCPTGYTLSKDGSSCQDVDECSSVNQKCTQPDEICVNIRGSYHCHTIVCPLNYIKDPNKPNRCNRAAYVCQTPTNVDCFKTPSYYTYSFTSMSSNMSIPPSGFLPLYSSQVTTTGISEIHFSLELINVRAGSGVSEATRSHFLLNKSTWNSAVIGLQKIISGPQEIELQLKVEYFANRILSDFLISKLFVFVSQYDF